MSKRQFQAFLPISSSHHFLHVFLEGAPRPVSTSQSQTAGPVILELPLEKIRRPLMRTRANDPNKVKELMDSIGEIGLQVPVSSVFARLQSSYVLSSLVESFPELFPPQFKLECLG